MKIRSRYDLLNAASHACAISCVGADLDAKMVARRAVYTAVDIVLSGGTTSLQQLALRGTCADGNALDLYILTMLGHPSTGATIGATGQRSLAIALRIVGATATARAGITSWSASDDGHDEVLHATITCRARGCRR